MRSGERFREWRWFLERILERGPERDLERDLEPAELPLNSRVFRADFEPCLFRRASAARFWSNGAFRSVSLVVSNAGSIVGNLGSFF